TRLLLLLLPSIVIVMLAAIVFLRNPKAGANRIYALFNIVSVSWLTCSYLADTVSSDTARLVFVKSAFFIGYLTVCCFLVLTWFFPRKSLPKTRTQVSLFFITIALGIMSIGPGLVSSIDSQHNVTNVIPGKLYPLFLLGTLYVFFSAIIRLVVLYKK